MLVQVVLSTTLSPLLPLQLRFECFQFAKPTKFGLLRSR